MNEFIKKALNRSTLYFTVGIFLYSLALLTVYAGHTSLSLDPWRVICLLPFCIAFAVANTTMQYKGIEAFTRWLIHIVLTVGGAFVFVILPAKLEGASSNFMGLIIIIALYLVGALVYALFNVRVRAAIKEDERLRSKEKKKK